MAVFELPVILSMSQSRWNGLCLVPVFKHKTTAGSRGAPLWSILGVFGYPEPGVSSFLGSTVGHVRLQPALWVPFFWLTPSCLHVHEL